MNAGFKNSIAAGIGIIISLFLLEIFLRIYNPFDFRLRGTDIILPFNRQYVITNTSIPGLDPIIHHTKNSLGFRGAEPPDDFNQYPSVVALGGSTTEQFYISDGYTWVDLLGKQLQTAFPRTWINNAGLDGHSTFGHVIMLEKYLTALRPTIILLLAGINEIDRNDLPSRADTVILKTVYANTLDFLAKKSEVVNFALTIARSWRARRVGVAHSFVDFIKMPALVLGDQVIAARLEAQKPYVAAYRERLVRIIDMAEKNKSMLILITQPLLWGAGKDPVTGVDLGTARMSAERNGLLYSNLLELYNEETRLAGKEKGILVIDLARLMPHDSRYYYDGIHFSNTGAEKVAEIVSEQLLPYLETHVGIY